MTETTWTRARRLETGNDPEGIPSHGLAYLIPLRATAPVLILDRKNLVVGRCSATAAHPGADSTN